ncbi:hypothetical protein E1A91_A13G029400v1 [Gossypium mustelinum]|uniref:Uncharacterized protein n=1 Tax=Gossypium mustelinum TaxID=34275 RepID=A0A5D2WDA4_GOSMU|nr:hypothetical protein E1A91_A13G029400v1 [Gossypium mustelinum]
MGVKLTGVPTVCQNNSFCCFENWEKLNIQSRILAEEQIMVNIKSPFPLILSCYLLVSFVFFQQGTVSRKLLGEGQAHLRSW